MLLMDDYKKIKINQIKDLNNMNSQNRTNISLNNKNQIKERYKEIYDILYDKKSNQNDEIKKQRIKEEKKSKSYRNNNNSNNLNALYKNQQKIKKFDYKISMLYDKIYSLQKQSLRKPVYAYPKIESDENLINDYQENNINRTVKIDKNKYNNNNFKTPFQKYKYDLYPKKKEKEQPLKLFKYSSKFYNTISTTEPNNIFYKNNKNQEKYTKINSVDRWINQEKNYININYYNDKKNEISDLVSFTKNYENTPLTFRNNNSKYYSDNYFVKELKRFTSLLNRTNDDKKISKSTFLIGNYYSKK